MSRKNRRVRPEREVFVALCQRHTQREIADKFGVSCVAVAHWQKLYGVKPLPRRTFCVVKRAGFDPTTSPWI